MRSRGFWHAMHRLFARTGAQCVSTGVVAVRVASRCLWPTMLLGHGKAEVAARAEMCGVRRPAGNTCMVQGGACYNANANAADFHKASLNFHYPQFACMPGRVWKTQQTEWHQDVSSLPQPIFVRAELAKVHRIQSVH